jgi:hypothetical protein
MLSTQIRRNPFNPGSGATPPYLAEREPHLNVFKNALASIEGGHVENIIVHGIRGTGKTVLLDEFNKICIDRGFLPIRRPQFSAKYCNTENFEKALKHDVRTALETFSTLSWFNHKFQAAVSFLKPKSVGIPELFYYEPSYERSKLLFEDFVLDYLKSNWPVFKHEGYRGVIFLYDEFHTVTDDERHRQYVLSDFLGAVNELQKAGCGYYMVLCGLPNLQLNVKKARSWSERMYKSIEVGNLDPDHSRLAIEKALEGCGYSFDADLVNALVSDTEGYPYFIQFYGKEVIDNIGLAAISSADYERVKPTITTQLDSDFFEPRFELASTAEQKILRAMARYKDTSMKGVSFGFITRRTHLSDKTVSPALARLENKGMVYNYKRGMYRFSLPMFQSFLQRVQ